MHKEIMPRLFAACFEIFLALLLLGSTAYGNETSIDDLLIPDLSFMNDKTEGNQRSIQDPKNDINIDDLLGPSDLFPFLPDNHRDSGTGKFNSF